MLVGEFINDMSRQLTEAGIQTARLDCLILLEDILERDRANLLAHPELEIPPLLLDKLNNFITQRKQHIPLAYIRGRSAFFGRSFMVNDGVLVPRPETESMIEILKEMTLPEGAKLADVGCGSGCLGITAKLEMPNIEVTLYDISDKALDVAKRNASLLKADVSIKHQDLLADVDQHFDVILANLPYVPHDFPINQAATHEPSIALFADNNGLALYERMFAQMAALNALKPSYVLTEALPQQLDSLADIAKAAGYHEKQRSGLVQLFAL